MYEMEKRQGVTTKVALGALLGGGSLLFASTLTVLAVTVALMLAAVKLNFARAFTVGSVLGVVGMLMFGPLVQTFVIASIFVIAIAFGLAVFFHSEPSSPTSRR